MLKKIVIANWKMNPLSSKEAEKLFGDIKKSISNIKKTEIVICPPFIFLEKLKSSKFKSKKIFLGAQNAFFEDVGAFTGEISSEMLYGLNVKYVILGHSERRLLGENNNDVNKKIKASLRAGLVPILCVGEKERDLEHEYFNVVKKQVEECLSGISKNSLSKIIIAYEPIWAISSTVDRRDASPEDSREMVIFIRKVLSDIYSPQGAGEVRIIYGGSVNEKDADGFVKDGGVDGLLVGRASLNAKKFVEIIKKCEILNK